MGTLPWTISVQSQGPCTRGAAGDVTQRGRQRERQAGREQVLSCWLCRWRTGPRAKDSSTRRWKGQERDRKGPSLHAPEGTRPSDTLTGTQRNRSLASRAQSWRG